MAPGGGVPGLSPKTIKTGDDGQTRLIELADCADDRMGLQAASPPVLLHI